MHVAPGLAAILSLFGFGAQVNPAAAAARRPNIPPIARGRASPEEAVVGAPVTFSAAGSRDPDNGPGPLAYAWDFGDGEHAEGIEASHPFGRPGRFPVTLTLSDGEDTTVLGLTVYVLAPALPRPSVSSAPLALAPDGSELWVANPDSGSVSVVDTAALVKVTEIAVGTEPRTLAFSPDGRLVAVACQGANELWVLDRTTRLVARRVRAEHMPFGVVVDEAGRAWVTNQGSASVLAIDLASGSTVARVALPFAEPRAVAIRPGKELTVSHYLSTDGAGWLSRIDFSGALIGTWSLAEDPGPDTPSSGRGIPNLLSALGLDPAGSTLWIGGLKSNRGRGLRLDGLPHPPTNWVRGALFAVDLAGSGGDDLGRRIDTNDADSVTGIAFSPAGRFAYLAHQGAGTLSIYDLAKASDRSTGDGDTVNFEARIDVGHAPQGVVVSPDGQRLYVSAYLSRSVFVIDAAEAAAPAVVQEIAVTGEPLPAAVANGKRLFYRSREPIHSKESYVACASCHPDGGGHDGLTWDFSEKGEGLRNTRDLRGRAGLGDGPLHWSGNYDEVQDFERDIVQHFGGTGLAADGRPPHPPLGSPNAGRSTDLDDLAAYVASLDRPPPSPYRGPGGTLTDGARRGRGLFGQLGCQDCHPRPRLTDSALTSHGTATSVLHDVGTMSSASGERLGGPLAGIDTPGLAGLWASAPYLHAGGATTLRDVFRGPTEGPIPMKNRMAELTATLSEAELDDLVAYLLSLDGTADGAGVAAGGGCVCSLDGRAPVRPPLLTLAATLLFVVFRFAVQRFAMRRLP